MAERKKKTTEKAPVDVAEVEDDAAEAVAEDVEVIPAEVVVAEEAI